ncbi:hypothetical protein EHS25_007053 [Saitozyma podzolica]|uniref:Uncharacterized protein n=1 Tax=Saitozyma podzolica TaxID=1890683 RepID=A0A427XPG1_9TREE|nr:hypothetical protein EHS25_007053 [Saitozyma podzolica]
MSTNENTNTFFSGGPGTTGREPFSDSSATGPGATFNQTGTDAGTGGVGGISSAGGVGAGPNPSAGYGTGIEGAGLESHHGHHHGHHGHHGHHSGAVGAEGARAQEYAGVAPGSAAAHTGTTGAVGTGLGSGAAGTGVGAGTDIGAQSRGDFSSAPSGAGQHVDRVGALGQEGALYEKTGSGGPVTSGAAGTDRFDAPSGGADYTAPGGRRTSSSQPGGFLGAVGTSSKDFTGRDSLGDTSGAYADTHGRFQGNANTQGTALTGREGNIANNPVAQAQSRSGDATGPGTVSGTGTATGGRGT